MLRVTVCSKEAKVVGKKIQEGWNTKGLVNRHKPDNSNTNPDTVSPNIKMVYQEHKINSLECLLVTHVKLSIELHQFVTRLPEFLNTKNSS